MGIACSGFSAQGSIKKYEKLANERAAALGFISNDEAFHLPFNVEASDQDTGHISGLCESDVECQNGMVSRNLVERLREDAAHLLSTRTPSEDDIRRMRLIRGPARDPTAAYAHLQMSPDNKTNDVLITVLEAASEEQRRDSSELGTSLICYHPALIFLLRNKQPTEFFSGCDEDRFYGLCRLFKCRLALAALVMP